MDLKEVQVAADALNGALLRAAAAGLRLDVLVVDITRIEDDHPVQIVVLQEEHIVAREAGHVS